MKRILIGKREVSVLANDTHISKWVEMAQRLDHDQNMLPLLNPYIHKGFTVIDVGAYIGDHTQYYVDRVGREGKVFAFEPNLPSFECLKFNMAKYPNVACFNMGASEKRHGISIAQSDNVGASHAVYGNDVECITIDSLKLQSCHFIKMDCEGMELKALKGAENTIAKFRPTMLLEINGGALERQGTSASEVFDWLAVNDYSFRNVYAEQGVEDEQLDVLCIPK